MASIPELSANIFILLAEHLDDTTLLAFRRTSKTLSTASDLVFVIRFFSEWHGYCSAPSLHVLSQVANSRLGRRMKSITIHALGEDRQRKALQDSFRGLTAIYWGPPGVSLASLGIDDPPFDRCSQDNWKGPECDDAIGSLLETMTGNVALDLLASAFRGLRAAGIKPSVGVGTGYNIPDQGNTDQGPCPKHRLRGKAVIQQCIWRSATPWWTTDRGRASADKVAPLVLKAIMVTGLQVSGLHLCDDYDAEQTYPLRKRQAIRLLGALRLPIWQCLRTLTLAIDGWIEPLQKIAEKTFFFWSKCCPALQQLKLVLPRIHSVPKDAMELLPLLVAPTIERLVLRHGCIGRDVLLSLLRSLRSQLRSLKLSNVVLGSVEGWEATLHVIAEEMQLEHLSLYGLRADDSWQATKISEELRATWHARLKNATLIWHGREAVRAGLPGMADSRRWLAHEDAGSLPEDHASAQIPHYHEADSDDSDDEWQGSVD